MGYGWWVHLRGCLRRATDRFFNQCVQGYFIRAVNLPRFWYYSFHWIDYQVCMHPTGLLNAETVPHLICKTFAFELLVRNDFTGMKFPCQIIDGSCQCSYPSSLIPGECAVSGKDVLQVCIWQLL